MSANLRKLYNTLLQVETKGPNTMIMADCLRYLERLIAEEEAKDAAAVDENGG